jgi:hypothetical protein
MDFDSSPPELQDIEKAATSKGTAKAFNFITVSFGNDCTRSNQLSSN